MNKIILCVGTGRSGTLTLQRLIEDVFRVNQHPQIVYHERDSRALYRLFRLHCESGDDSHRQQARRLIQGWEPGCAIVGNGYQQYLNDIYEIHGECIRLIVLKREREACVRSMLRFFEEIMPDNTLYYTQEQASEGTYDWFTAFHLGEMTPAQWRALSLADKLYWYYDVTYALIHAARSQFDASLDLATESLSERESLQQLSSFIHPDGQCPPHLPRHINAGGLAFSHISSLTSAQQQELRRFYMGFDFFNAAQNPFEGDLFYWHQISERLQRLPAEHRNALIQHYEKLLEQRLQLLQKLKG